jgi:hypothetical protein
VLYVVDGFQQDGAEGVRGRDSLELGHRRNTFVFGRKKRLGGAVRTRNLDRRGLSATGG